MQWVPRSVLESPAPPDLADREAGCGRASAKLILFGEHVVLYGKPAISLPVPSLPVTAEARRWDGPVVVRSSPLDTGRSTPAAPSRRDASALTRLAVSVVCENLGLPDDGLFVSVDSGIPAGRGFGSSAASSAAIIRAVAGVSGRTLDHDTMFALIQRSEAFAHGKASGVDARTVISAGGPIWFQGGAATPLTVPTGESAPVLVVADTGVYGSTREAVALVRERVTELGTAGQDLLDRAGTITSAAATDLTAARFAALGEKMTAAHDILAQLGVSCPEIETLVAAALDANALGAKLSGGGLGGCVIALAADPEAAVRLEGALAAAGAQRCHTVPLGPI
ncbi:mevalonate kinase [Nocardia transvalensis]|uniref:Mevalonate kinase n=1 Tax=Nocardia transvalensis TaxID=37333 RepID=A0A7W9UGY6_9NOCA|nr:mevalonate kinase [Nocardia transvalensis]MBB5912150.1 mevalonate kinase [Nocardia transvalensis]